LAQADVFSFREPKDESVPLLEWLDQLPPKVKAKCIERIDRLGELGHELRRPGPTFCAMASTSFGQVIKGFIIGCCTSSREKPLWSFPTG
jgi:hypothetical protein